jgi:type II secretory pathway pseudopilin PulG
MKTDRMPHKILTTRYRPGSAAPLLTRAPVGNRPGFTVVESLVTTAISSLIVGVMFTILQFNNQGVSNAAVNTRIQMQYETVIDRIGFDTRRASAVLDGATETWATYQAGGSFPAVRTTCIEMFDDAGQRIRGYKVDGTTLYEWVSGSGYVPFAVSGNPVQVLGNFAIARDRKQDTVLLRVFSTFMRQSDTTAIRMERFFCRN